MNRLVFLLLVLYVSSAAGQTPGANPITSAVTGAISNSSDGVLPAIATLLGILVTVGVGWAIVRTLKG